MVNMMDATYEKVAEEMKAETLDTIVDPKKKRAVKRSFEYPSKRVHNAKTKLARFARVHVWAVFGKGRPLRYDQESEHVVELYTVKGTGATTTNGITHGLQMALST